MGTELQNKVVIKVNAHCRGSQRGLDCGIANSGLVQARVVHWHPDCADQSCNLRLIGVITATQYDSYFIVLKSDKSARWKQANGV